ncbi:MULTISPECIES: GPW/gp25 family protein [unclassified Chelatococcus]|uniref:GPW/gp25 family protein n=1 Tax=unclassified Chelatococcus TaxID=2638111 RepID=UPI001BD03E6E|nr:MULTISPECIES: GPW/gp25 family protein [unclassified Chelatococcus]MBS7697301.1 GPW/gp25 family protein [Chelatococcus sp. YT9]MBX3556402.1 GPW/gp25 family protein [Chelatococcus sp.]
MSSSRQSGAAEQFPASLRERLAIDGVVHVDFMRLRDRLRGDIEVVLNTRQPAGPLPSGLPELQRSLLCFGLADPSASSVDGSGREAFCRKIEQSLPIILPQLMSVRVEAVGEDHRENTCVHLRISAVVCLALGSRSLLFDTRYTLDTGRFTVESAGE